MSRGLIVSCTIALAFAIAGCSGPMGNPSRRTSGLVPDRATLAASGKPTISHYTSGGIKLYVVDETAKSLIFSGDVPAGDEVMIKVDGDSGSLVVDAGGEPTVLAKPIEKSHRYSIWTTAPTTRPAEDV